MDGFQDGGYIRAQGVLQYHLIEVPWKNAKKKGERREKNWKMGKDVTSFPFCFVFASGKGGSANQCF